YLVAFFLKCCWNFSLCSPFFPGFSRRVLFPLSCIESRSFCFLIKCPPNWIEIGRCLPPTEMCFRRGK
uniref:Beta-defensin-like domain-containing protein n=2 Tax=Equus TaxID=9789 RepID=A0A3Q2I4Y3_HORSE